MKTLEEIETEIIGLDLDEAEAQVSPDWRLRVTEDDTGPLLVTCDYCNTRINIATKEGAITKVFGLG